MSRMSAAIVRGEAGLQHAVTCAGALSARLKALGQSFTSAFAFLKA
jgi:hypothetical protein